MKALEIAVLIINTFVVVGITLYAYSVRRSNHLIERLEDKMDDKLSEVWSAIDNLREKFEALKEEILKR